MSDALASYLSQLTQEELVRQPEAIIQKLAEFSVDQNGMVFLRDKIDFIISRWVELICSLNDLGAENAWRKWSSIYDAQFDKLLEPVNLDHRLSSDEVNAMIATVQEFMSTDHPNDEILESMKDLRARTRPRELEIKRSEIFSLLNPVITGLLYQRFKEFEKTRDEQQQPIQVTVMRDILNNRLLGRQGK